MTETDASPRPAPPLRSSAKAALLSRGFRPFFLAAALWAMIAMALWLPIYNGELDWPMAWSPIDWHAHEFLFGYAGAVLAGFLLTAIPNWTGRLPVSGAPLAGLAALWACGRVAVSSSAGLGPLATALVDLAFFVALAAVAAREVIAGGHRRNYVVAAIVTLFAFVDLAFHVEAARRGTADYSARAALATLVLLILLIGGRVTPSFTANWLQRAGAKSRPAPFDRNDGVIVGVSAVALGLWVVWPETDLTGAAALLAGAANFWRLSRWRGFAARSDALLAVLHVGFGLAALGFLAVSAHALAPAAMPYAAAVHVWAVGAIGTMTLAMMTRATLGHSGDALVATPAAKLAYLSIAVALMARLAMAYFPAWGLAAMHAAAGAWLVAFAAFLYGFAPKLVKNRLPGKD